MRKIEAKSGHRNTRSLLRGLVFLTLCGCFAYAPNVRSQWKQLTTLPGNTVKTVYFLDLPGAPRVGFITDGVYMRKTTDGGFTWRQLSSLPIGIVYDFAFKDSITGWAASEIGCLKTTDGGETWIALPGVPVSCYGIYYDRKNNGLFLATDWWSLVSWDEGTNWVQQLSADDHFFHGFSFWNDDTGIITGQDKDPLNWQLTTDGGVSWSQLVMDSTAFQPVAICGTSTAFTNTVWGSILRTDDLWNTWKVIYQFPWPPSIPRDRLNPPSSGCIRGDTNDLYVTNGWGCFRSTDLGLSWNYLCGQPSGDVGAQRFYVKEEKIYIIAATSAGSTLWMLNVDSMQNFPTGIEYPNHSHDTSISVGTPLTLNFAPQTNDPIGIDSGHLVFRFDSNVLDVKQIILPTGWKILSSSTTNGVLDLRFTGDNSLPNPIVQIVFNTYLNSSSTKVYLDSAHLYGKRLNCDCDAISLLAQDSITHSAPDSVTVHFTGCGDSTILAGMHGELPIIIESISPNPARNEITVRVSGSGSPSSGWDAELDDMLGHPVLAQHSTRSTQIFSVSSLPSGAYYLRLSSGGYIVTRRIMVER